MPGPEDFFPFGQPFDQIPPPNAPRTFADWAPLVLGHLQRIESSQAVIIRDVAVIQTKMEGDREWKAEVEARLSLVEAKLHEAAIKDAGRVGMVQGGWKVWTGIVAIASTVAAVVAWLIERR